MYIASCAATTRSTPRRTRKSDEEQVREKEEAEGEKANGGAALTVAGRRRDQRDSQVSPLLLEQRGASPSTHPAACPPSPAQASDKAFRAECAATGELRGRDGAEWSAG